jgi:hypothetical protein
MSPPDAVDAPAWQEHPGTLEFGEAYLCADAAGVPFRQLLVAGNARDSANWRQVAWAMPIKSIPRPPVGGRQQGSTT